jgi:catechol 2,3-dioxygenase-like lactoylglutathione lyase family enzyme
MQINRIDHLVITVADIERSVDFYQSVLGMQRIEFAGGRVALRCGAQKINLHQLGSEFEPKAQQVKAGSADLCFIADTPINEALEQFRQQGVELIDGPVERSGANGAIISLYLRDPDGNLIEISNYLNEEDKA